MRDTEKMSTSQYNKCQCEEEVAGEFRTECFSGAQTAILSLTIREFSKQRPEKGKKGKSFNGTPLSKTQGHTSS